MNIFVIFTHTTQYVFIWDTGLNIFYFIYIQWNKVGPQVLTTLESVIPIFVSGILNTSPSAALKEIYLSYKLTNGVSKEKILELYLNKIAFWSNSYGIEQAAQTFFGVPASELWILESSLLASLPKWPTYYSPYSHYDRLVGYPYIYTVWDEENAQNIISKKTKDLNTVLLERFKNFISGNNYVYQTAKKNYLLNGAIYIFNSSFFNKKKKNNYFYGYVMQKKH